MKQANLSAAGCLLAILLVVACGSGGIPAAGAPSASPTGPVVAAVGQPMAFSDGRSVTVLAFKLRYVSGNKFEVPTAGNQYVKVTYALFNGSPNEWSLPLLELQLVDANGQKYRRTVISGQGTVDSLVAGGKTPSVVQIYQVPDGIALDVVWQPNLLSSVTAQTPLK